MGLQVLLVVASLWTQDVPAAPAATCREWQECRRLAQEAYARGEYERFHDLAWRTVQTGPARNPDLMYLLARAQSLSGRPHDAFVMLGRLAQMGFATSASTDDDFKAVRQLRQWQELEPSITTAARPASSASPAAAPTPAAPAPAPPTPAVVPDVAPPSGALPAETSSAAAPPVVVSAPVPDVAREAEEALRVPGKVLGKAGLAYDRVSSRFVVADSGLRKLIIIDERSRHLVDLVTSASAGFFDITALEIDPSRGDLWVASAEPAGTTGDRSPESALHKLQLLSGRPLSRTLVPAGLQPCRLADVAVTNDGRVLVLDTAGNRVLRFQPATSTFTTVATLHLQSPTSIAAAGDRIVYVAHESGIARIDSVTGAVESVKSTRDVQMVGFERIRWARDSLVGVQRQPDGSERVVRVKVVNRRAAAMDVIQNGLSSTGHAVSTVSGDEFYFLVHQPDGSGGDLVIRRSRLR